MHSIYSRKQMPYVEGWSIPPILQIWPATWWKYSTHVLIHCVAKSLRSNMNGRDMRNRCIGLASCTCVWSVMMVFWISMVIQYASSAPLNLITRTLLSDITYNVRVQGTRCLAFHDKLFQHLQSQFHGMQTMPDVSQWKYTVASMWARECGFCGIDLMEWNTRVTHIEGIS